MELIMDAYLTINRGTFWPRKSLINREMIFLLIMFICLHSIIDRNHLVKITKTNDNKILCKVNTQNPRYFIALNKMWPIYEVSRTYNH